MFSNEDVVFAYTRKEAIADGVQFPLSEKFPEACIGFKIPVFCTARVWALIESVNENANSLKDVIRDICYVSATEIKRKAMPDQTRMDFEVSITGANLTPDSYFNGRPLYKLVALIGPVDIYDPRPAITIAFPDEE